MITKVQEQIADNIRGSIKNNGIGAITGNLLQEKMLLLNGAPFDGEIDFSDSSGNKLGQVLLLSMLNVGRLQGVWKTFMDEFEASDYVNVYIAVYDSEISGSGKVVSYLHLRRLGEKHIKCVFLCNIYSELYSFEVSGNNWTFSEVKFLAFV